MGTQGARAGDLHSATMDGARRELSQSRALWVSSAGRDWDGFAIDEFGGVLMENAAFPARDHHVLTMALGCSAMVMQERCGKRFESPTIARQFTLMPAGYRTRWHGAIPPHLTIRLDPHRLARAACEYGKISAAKLELASVFRLEDATLSHFAELLRLELRRPAHPVQELIVTSLISALSLHVIRCHTSAAGAEAYAAKFIDSGAIRRVLAYVHDESAGPCTLRQLAAVAGVSPFHFARLFKKQVGVAPIHYVEQIRIERAQALIRRGDLPLCQVALAAGFADQSHFTRRFRAHTGKTPAQFARERAA